MSNSAVLMLITGLGLWVSVGTAIAAGVLKFCHRCNRKVHHCEPQRNEELEEVLALLHG